MALNESIVEDATLEWLGGLGYVVSRGSHMAPGAQAEEREEALGKGLRVATSSLTQTTRTSHRLLSDTMLLQPPSGGRSVRSSGCVRRCCGTRRMTLTINEVLQRSNQGRTRPYICRADNGEIYYVKGHSATRNGLMAEWLCAELATAFGLPIAPYALATVPEELIEADTTGWLADLGGWRGFRVAEG